MAVDVTVPQLGESIVEATVGRWLKGQGDAVQSGDPLVELETDKVNMEVVAPENGTLATITRKEGETVAIGDVLATIAEGATVQEEAPAVPQPAAPVPTKAPSAVAATAVAEEQQADSNGIRSTPLARRIASDYGVDIATVKGSGPEGRVTREDVTAFVQQTKQSAHPGPRQDAETGTPSARGPAPAGEAGVGRPEARVRMSRRRQTIARRLVEAQQTAAMLTTFNEVDMSAIVALRKSRRDSFKEKHGIGLGFMSFFTKAVISALKEFPRLNAEIQGDEIVLKRYYDIGIAVGVEDGLVVPVVRDADRLTFAGIEAAIADLAGRAREGRLTLEDLQGGTFTITNGGIYGSLLSTPILNIPQVGILGMHKIQDRAVVVNGGVVVRPMMYLALSYDHRIVDGNEAVRFLVRVKENLEDPTLLLLES